MSQETAHAIALLGARVTLGGVFFAHGAQKVFGWFGGFGIRSTAGYFQNTLGVPTALAYFGVFAELAAGILLIFGVATGFAALIVIMQMIAAIYLSHIKDGFFMNYFGQLPAGREGFEYNIVLIAMALILLFAGAGRYSLDALWGSDFLRKAIDF